MFRTRKNSEITDINFGAGSILATDDVNGNQWLVVAEGTEYLRLLNLKTMSQKPDSSLPRDIPKEPRKSEKYLRAIT